MFKEKEKLIVRELARKYMEQISTDKQAKMRQRFRDTNDLKIVRPPVLIDEIPWCQMNIDNELTCVCETEAVREVEYFFRKALFYLKHFRADNIYDDFFRVQKTVESTGIGLSKTVAVTKKTDEANNIVSRKFEDVLEDEAALDKLRVPEFTLRTDIDASNMEFYTALLGDSISVKLCGYKYFGFNPWDDIAFLRGVEPIFIDMYDRPEYLHAIMEKFVAAASAEMDFVEKVVGIDPESTSMHCTPAPVSGLSSEGLKAGWFRGTAQPLGVVSPDMFEEFEIKHIRPLAEKFAYTYYGCCEPLDNKMDVITKISNLRKIGCSPWANVEVMAEQIGNKYVLARKPNPANVAVITDPDVIRSETEETVKACIKYGCPCEFVLKDISTVANRPENLIIWSEVINEVLDKYY